MKTKLIASILGLVLALAIAGCASYTHEELAAQAEKIGYGTPPHAEKWQPAVRELMSDYLKDPFSAQYQFGEPYRGWVNKAPIEGGGFRAVGYLVQVNVNAKNSYGGYTGWSPYRFLIKDDELIGSCDDTGFWNVWKPIK